MKYQGGFMKEESVMIVILDLTYKLQYELERMSDEELKNYLRNKVLRYDNKLWVLKGDADESK